MIRFAVVSSRIFDCPCSLNDIVGGMLRPASILRTSFDASSSAWPGATSAIRLTVNCRFERCSVVGPRPRSSRAMLSMRTGPARRRHRQPADLRDVAPLVLEHADLDRILLLPFLEERDLVVAGDGEPQRVADGRHPHAEIGGALAIDGDVDLRVRDVEADLDLGEARHLLRGHERLLRILRDLVEIRPEDVRGDRESAGAFAAAERGARADARPVALDAPPGGAASR